LVFAASSLITQY